MEIKVAIKTPKGLATSTLGKLKKFLLGFSLKRVKSNCYVNEDDSIIYMNIEADLKRCLKIQKNVIRYDTIMRMALDSKRVKKILSQEGCEELEDMLTNQTTVEIVKMATAQEVEENGKSFWTNIKEKLKRVNPF